MEITFNGIKPKSASIVYHLEFQAWQCSLTMHEGEVYLGYGETFEEALREAMAEASLSKIE